MVKTPHTRHSATPKDPVTIDLTPGEVSRVKAEAEKAAKDTQASASADAGSTPPKPAVPGTGQSTSTDAKPATPPAGDTASAAAKDAEKPATKPAEDKTRTETMSKPAGPAASGAAASPRPQGAGSATSFGRQDPQKPAAAPAPRSGGGMVAGGVTGGVIALLVAGGLSYSGLLPGGSVSQDQGGQVRALEAQIEELRQQVQALGAGSGDTAGLSERIAGTDERVGALASELEGLRAEVERLSGAAPAEGGEAVDLAPIEQRIAAIETAIAGLGGSTNPEAALAAVDKQIETLRTEIASVRDTGSAASARIEAVEQAVAALTQRVNEQAEAPAAAIIIAAFALKTAIDRGTPFVTELDTYASLAPDASVVAELRGVAATGVPTRAQIAAKADAAANAMIAAARPVDADAGVIDRLWASAMGLVQVRPIGMVEGTGVPEIAARIDAAVSSNDYERAIAEYDTLPEGAKAAAADFMAKVRTRHSVDRLVDQALAAALKA